MKTLFWFLPIVLLCSCATPSDRKVSHEGILPEISAPQSLDLMSEAYDARDSASDGKKCIVEYYRAGEGQKSWKKMLALRLSSAGLDSLQLVQNLENSAKAGRASAVRSFKGKNKNDYGVEFTLMSHGVLELDVFRCVNRTNGSGTISFQYAEKIPYEQLRELGESQVPDFYAKLRLKVVTTMQTAPIPAIEFTQNEKAAKKLP